MDLLLNGAELCREALAAGRWKKADVKGRLASSALGRGTSHLTEHLSHSGSTWSWGVNSVGLRLLLQWAA